jgi:hypothetical protein
LDLRDVYRISNCVSLCGPHWLWPNRRDSNGGGGFARDLERRPGRELARKKPGRQPKPREKEDGRMELFRRRKDELESGQASLYLLQFYD